MILWRHPRIKVDQKEKISFKFTQKLTRHSYNLKSFNRFFSSTSNESRNQFPDPCLHCIPLKKKLFRSTKKTLQQIIRKNARAFLIWNARYKVQFRGLYRLFMWTIVMPTGAQNPWGNTPPLTSNKTSQTNTPQNLSFLLLWNTKT